MKVATNHTKKLLKKRLFAFSIDLMAIGIFEKVALLTLKMTVSGMLLHASSKVQAGLSPAIRSFELPMLIACYFGYFFTCLLLTNGHTLGKAIMNLKVHRPGEPNSPLTPYEALMRTTGYLVCYLSAGLLFLLPFLNRSKKGIPDWISGTVVSDEEYLEEISRLQAPALHLVTSTQLTLFPEDPAATSKEAA